MNYCKVRSIHYISVNTSPSSSFPIADEAMCDFAAATNASHNFHGWTCTGRAPDISVCTWGIVTCQSQLITSINIYSGLSYSGRNMKGTIPSSLGDLSSLNTLRLPNLQLAGTIPSSLGSLVSLTWLQLSGNSFTGSIPSALLALSQIQHIDLSNNKLVSSLPTSLSNLYSCTYLALAGNHLTGNIPTELFDGKSSLAYVLLDTNSLSGTIPWTIASCVALNWLQLSTNNKLSGSIPSGLCASSDLGHVDVSNTGISCYPSCLATTLVQSYLSSLVTCDSATSPTPSPATYTYPSPSPYTSPTPLSTPVPSQNYLDTQGKYSKWSLTNSVPGTITSTRVMIAEL